MKRIAWTLASVVAAIGALLVLGFALLPRETLKTRIGEQIAAWTGRDVSLRGEPEISFFPELTVTLRDVQVGGPDGMTDAPIISMDRLKGTIRLLPLIVGEVQVGSFTMVRPQVRLVVDEKGQRNWVFNSGAAALQLAFAGDVPLGEFRLRDGTVAYENRQTKTSERLDSVNLRVRWESVRNPLVITGAGIWHGENVTVASTAKTPFAFLQGDVTPVDGRLDSAPVSVQFSGEGSGINDPRLTGALTMSAASLRGFASWLGSPIGPGSTLGEARLAGTATFHDNVLSVENAQVQLDDNAATGALKVVAAVKPEITGTLAFRQLNLTPYFAGFSGAFGPGKNWRSMAIATDWLRDFSADIRLSADAVTAGQLGLGDTAASVSLRDGKLEVGLARAAFGGGSLAGTLSVTDGAAKAEAAAEAQLRAAGFDLGRAGPLLGFPSGLAGTGSLMTDLTSRGNDLGALVANLGGTAELDVANGAFPLFGIAEIAAGGEPRPTGAAATNLTKLTANLSFGQGVAVLESGSVATPAFTADARGRIVLADGALAMGGTITPALPAGAPPTPFTIEGTLVQPVAKATALAN